MNTYTPYRNPSFMDGQPMPPAVVFETAEELLACDDVRLNYTPDTKYVMSDGYLMALTKDGFHWWVLGKIGDPSAISLPKWTGAKIKVRFDSGEERVVQGGEVAIICGEEITLRDGTKTHRV